MEKIKLDEFFNYQFLSNLKSNPSQDKLAFVVSHVNEKSDSYDRSIWIKEKEIKQLTNGQHESLFIWMNDETILFQSMRDEEDKKLVEAGEERSVFYQISVKGGEASKAFTIPLNISQFLMINDDQYIMCVNYHLETSKMYLLNDSEKALILKQKKKDQTVEVIDELPFYGNGAGFTNKHRSRLMVYTVSSQSIEFITEEKFDIDGFNLSEDKTTVYYWGSCYDVNPEMKSGVYQYNFNSQSVKQLLREKVASIYHVAELGNELLVVANFQKKYGINENPEFYTLKDEELHLLVAFDQSVGNSVGSDCRLGGGEGFIVDKGTAYFITTHANASHIYSLDASGEIKQVFTPEGSCDALAMSSEGMVVIGLLNNELQELYRVNDSKKLSAFNEIVHHNKYVADYESVQFVQDGITLDGWVLKPIDYDPNKKYPAILDIHGGPKTVYGKVFYHEMQYWANCGYFVFFMNPRGSDGRGNEFADIRGKYGTIDYDDLMKFTDIVLEKYPAIDKTRVGETGGSYGGFMSNWMNGHTDRFAAIASQRSISNWLGFSFTSDIGPYFAADQCDSSIFKDPEKLWWHSPLKYAENAKTPTLFIHSDEDYRCPLAEGYQMVSALMHHGVPARLVMFKGENHELSRSGKPSNRVRRLDEITKWMDKYCKGDTHE